MGRLEGQVHNLTEQLEQLPRISAANALLDAKIASFETEMEHLVAGKVAEKQIEYRDMLAEKTQAWQDAEYTLLRQVDHLKQQVETCQEALHQNQSNLIAQSAEQRAKLDAKVSEAQMLVSELERMQGRLAARDRENAELKSKLATTDHSSEITTYDYFI